MTTLEDISAKCLAVCQVPIDLSRNVIISHVQRHLEEGKIVDLDQVDVVDTDKNFRRVLLLFTSEGDVNHICRDVKQEEYQHGDDYIVVKYKKAIACELPDRWKGIETLDSDKKELESSAGLSQPQVRPPLPPRRSEYAKLSERDQQQQQQYQLPTGPFGTMSGFHHNKPQGQPKGFNENDRGHAQQQNVPFSPVKFQPGPKMFAKPPFPYDPQNAKGGLRMPLSPGKPIPMRMYIDPQTGQPLSPYPPQFSPHVTPQQVGHGDVPRDHHQQLPTGPPPPFNHENVIGQEYSQPETVDEEPAGSDWEPDTGEKPTKIVVSNLPSTVHEEYLEMFFENKRKFGGVTVFNVDLDEESKTAVVEFEEPESVDIVLNKSPLKMMGKEVDVEVFKPEPPLQLCTIEVTGPSRIVCEAELETLELYFENTTRSGGDTVVDCVYDDENNMVLVTFETEEVAQRVKERGSHVVRKGQLQVTLHVPGTKTEYTNKTEEKEEEEEHEAPNTIKVQGVNKSESNNIVEYYFENTKRSGGGEIKKVYSDDDDEDVLYITFVNKKDAESVVKRESHHVYGKELSVSLYKPPVPPPCYDDKIIIKGLKSSTTQDVLFNFIEAKTGFIPETMEHHSEHENEVMVTFSGNPDFHKLKNTFRRSKLEGAYLKTARVPISNCILVSNLPSEVTKDTLAIFFENTRKTGGGAVEKVVMNEDNTCLVYFEDNTIIDRILRRTHRLGGQDLEVKCYYEFLGKPYGKLYERFPRLNTVVEVKVPCTQNAHRLIDKHHKQDLQTIANSLQEMFVQISLVPGYSGLEVRGTEDGIQKAKDKLSQLLERVQKREHIISKPGLAKHMQTPKGKDNLNTIESNLKCVFAVKGDVYDTLPVDSGISENIQAEGVKILGYCKAFDCRNIYIVEGDMTELKVDILVHSADEKLSLAGGLGKAIVRKGGKQIQNECADYIRNEGGLGNGEVFVSTGGNLKASHIVHVRGPMWKGGMQKEDEMLEEAVFKCLQQGSTRNLVSVAIPAINCGTYGYPVKKATSTIVKAVKNFFREVQDSTVTDVYLTDMKHNTVEAFSESLSREFGASNFRKYDIKEKKRPRSAAYWWNKTNTGDDQYARPKMKKKPEKQIDPNTVTFIILALSDNIIDQAVQRLESLLSKEIYTKRFDDSIITRMDDNQILEIRAVAQQYHLDMDLQSANGYIHISGIAANVMSASDKIHRLMREAVTLDQVKNSATLMINLVQWSYIEVTATGQNLQPYDKDLNNKIESAYKSKAPKFKFRAGNMKYVINFKKMEEYPEDDPIDVVTVLRRDLSKEAFEQPLEWADMVGNLRVVSLQASSQEYTDISQKFLASAGAAFIIQKVERIQNKTLWSRYQAKKKQLDDQNPPGTINERMLWHGTSADTVDNINAHGFNRNYCGKIATAYGEGVYFAVNAQYTCSPTYSRPDPSGIKRVYHCRVLTGEFTRGRSGMRAPPNKVAAGSKALYDSVADNPAGPGMFIIFHDTQAYPGYLISFK